MHAVALVLLGACAPSGSFDRFELPPRNVTGFAGSSADDVWVSGEGPTPNVAGNLMGLSHWDGATWSDVPLPEWFAADADRAALTPPASVLGGAFVVGGEVYQTALTQWTGFDNAQRSAGDGALWYLGDGALGTLDADGTWTVATNLPEGLDNGNHMLASAPDGVLALFAHDNVRAWTWHWWDGAALSDLPAPDGYYPLKIVSVFGRDDMWVALGPVEGDNGGTWLGHFDGTAWTITAPSTARYAPFNSGPVARTDEGYAWVGDDGALVLSDGATFDRPPSPLPERYTAPPQGIGYGVRMSAVASDPDGRPIALTHEREIKIEGPIFHEQYALVSWHWSGQAWVDRTVLLGRPRCYACDAWTFLYGQVDNGDFVGFWNATVNDHAPEGMYTGTPR